MTPRAEIVVRAQALIDALGARYHGRMPDDVQAAFDALRAVLQASPSPSGSQAVQCATCGVRLAFKEAHRTGGNCYCAKCVKAVEAPPVAADPAPPRKGT